MSRISYLIVHWHEKTWKDASFNMTLERKEESDNKKIERHGMYVENPIKGWLTTVWVRIKCSCSSQTVLCVKRGQSCTIRMFSFLSYQLFTLFCQYLFEFLP